LTEKAKGAEGLDRAAAPVVEWVAVPVAEGAVVAVVEEGAASVWGPPVNVYALSAGLQRLTRGGSPVWRSSVRSAGRI